MKREAVFTYFLLIAFGIWSAVQYTRVAINIPLFADYQRQLLAHTLDAPMRYRVLSGWIVQPLIWGSGDSAIAVAYSIAHLIFLPILLCVLYAWLRVWVDNWKAAAGAILTAFYLQIMFTAWGFSLYSAVEAILLCSALIILIRRPRGWLIAVVILTILATLNRETGILIPLSYLALDRGDWRQRSYWARGITLIGTWFAVFIGLRFSLGFAPDAFTLGYIWSINTGAWGLTEAILNHLPFVPIWVLAGIHYKGAPQALRRLAWAIVPYLVLFLIYGVWREVRLLLPIWVIVLPTALFQPERSQLGYDR